MYIFHMSLLHHKVSVILLKINLIELLYADNVGRVLIVKITYMLNIYYVVNIYICLITFLKERISLQTNYKIYNN